MLFGFEIMAKRVLAFSKTGHTYVFRYPVGSEDTMVDVVMQLAEDPDSPLDWLDAATLSFQAAQYAAEACSSALLPSQNEPR